MTDCRSTTHEALLKERARVRGSIYAKEAERVLLAGAKAFYLLEPRRSTCIDPKYFVQRAPMRSTRLRWTANANAFYSAQRERLQRATTWATLTICSYPFYPSFSCDTPCNEFCDTVHDEATTRCTRSSMRRRHSEKQHRRIAYALPRRGYARTLKLALHTVNYARYPTVPLFLGPLHAPRGRGPRRGRYNKMLYFPLPPHAYHPTQEKRGQ